jgi:hypothetical protein
LLAQALIGTDLGHSLIPFGGQSSVSESDVNHGERKAVTTARLWNVDL